MRFGETNKLTPELNLALACAAWPPSRHGGARILRAQSLDIDWERFLVIAQRHGVIGLVHHALARGDLGPPSNIEERIRREGRQQAVANLSLTAESVRLQELFDDAGIHVVFLKGAALSALAYGDVAIRSSKDIDLLVAPTAWQASVSTLASAGYEVVDPALAESDPRTDLIRSLRKDYTFQHTETGHVVEMHWRPFVNPHLLSLGFFERSRRVGVSNGRGLETLRDHDLFNYLIAHGAGHWWGQIKWLADIMALTAGKSPDELSSLVAAAHTAGVGEAAGRALWLAATLLDDRRSRLPGSLDRGWKDRLLDQTAVSRIEMRAATVEGIAPPFGSTRGSLAAALSATSLRYLGSELRSLMYNQSDILSVRLPRWLWFTYPLLRFPLWLRRQWGRELLRGSQARI